MKRRDRRGRWCAGRAASRGTVVRSGRRVLHIGQPGPVSASSRLSSPIERARGRDRSATGSSSVISESVRHARSPALGGPQRSSFASRGTPDAAAAALMERRRPGGSSPPGRFEPRNRCRLWADDEVALHREVVAGHGAGEAQVADVVGHDPLELLDAGIPVGQPDVRRAVGLLQLRVGADVEVVGKPAVLSMRKTTVSPGVTAMSRICSPSCRKRIAASASSSMTRASPLGGAARRRPASSGSAGGRSSGSAGSAVARARRGAADSLGLGGRPAPRPPRRCPAWCSSGRPPCRRTSGR